MKEKSAEKAKKTKGYRSLTVMLVSIICIMVSIPTIGLAVLGVHYLKQSMEESAELYEETMNDGYSMEIKSQVQGAMSLVQSYYDRCQNGEFTEEEAKQRAAEAVRHMRYRDDDSGYIWIDGEDQILSESHLFCCQSFHSFHPHSSRWQLPSPRAQTFLYKQS